MPTSKDVNDSSTTKVHPLPTCMSSSKNNNQLLIEKINNIIFDIWLRYDQDGNGTLDSNEFSLLVSDTMSTLGTGDDVPDEEEMIELLELADADGDGQITHEEFHSMMMGFFTMSTAEREEMASISSLFCKLMIFTESLTVEAEGRKSNDEDYCDSDEGSDTVLTPSDWRPDTPSETVVDVAERKESGVEEVDCESEFDCNSAEQESKEYISESKERIEDGTNVEAAAGNTCIAAIAVAAEKISAQDLQKEKLLELATQVRC